MQKEQDKLILKYIYAKDKRISDITVNMKQNGFNGKRIKGVLNAVRNLENEKIDKISEMITEFKKQNMTRNEIEYKIKEFAKIQDKIIKKIIEENNIKGIDLNEFSIKEYVILTGEEKALLVQELIKNENIFKLQTSKEVIAQIDIKIPARITKHKQFIEYIQNREDVFMNYFKVFTNWKIGKFYKCILYVGNFAWIAKDNNGVVRYFSKNRITNKSFALNIFDLIELRENIEIETSMGFKKARKILARDLNVTYKELDWEISQEDKYRSNIGIINTLDIKERYPNIYKLSANHLYILENFNEFALSNIKEKKESVKGEAVFYYSFRNAEESINKDHSVVGKVVNLFAVLGLINKVHPKDVSNDMLYLARELSNLIKCTIDSKNDVELVNFYTIPLYNADVFLNAEKIATKLVENKITNSTRVTQKNIENIFGKVFAKKVYPKFKAVDRYSDGSILKLIRDCE